MYKGEYAKEREQEKKQQRLDKFMKWLLIIVGVLLVAGYIIGNSNL